MSKSLREQQASFSKEKELAQQTFEQQKRELEQERARLEDLKLSLGKPAQ